MFALLIFSIYNQVVARDSWKLSVYANEEKQIFNKSNYITIKLWINLWTTLNLSQRFQWCYLWHLIVSECGFFSPRVNWSPVGLLGDLSPWGVSEGTCSFCDHGACDCGDWNIKYILIIIYLHSLISFWRKSWRSFYMTRMAL